MARRILDLFFKIEDDGAGGHTTGNQPPAQQSQAASARAHSSTATAVPTMAGGIGQEDAEIRQQLAKALEDANLEGYDYFEFAKAIEAQISLIPAEALRFQSTFATAAVMGVSVDKLLSTANQYMSILKKKEQEFLTALETHTAQTVTAREGELKKIDEGILAKSEQIRKLTEEINALQAQKTSVQNEIGTGRMEIEKVKNNFFATLRVFTSKISGDMEKIKTYLSPTGGA